MAQGRSCCERRAWEQAYRWLSGADAIEKLGAEDLERLFCAAYMLQREEEALEILERVHQSQLDGGDMLAAARTACWLGLHSAFSGQIEPASGWFGRAGRLLEDSSDDCVEQGYLLLPRVHMLQGAPRCRGETRGPGDRGRGRAAPRLDVDNVVWCTGYRPGFEWIELPIFDRDTGYPRHERGVAIDQPGLYFVGLHFLHAATSATVTGMCRDAKYVAQAVAARMRAVAAGPRATLQPPAPRAERRQTRDERHRSRRS